MASSTRANIDTVVCSSELVKSFFIYMYNGSNIFLTKSLMPYNFNMETWCCPLFYLTYPVWVIVSKYMYMYQYVASTTSHGHLTVYPRNTNGH